MLSKQKKYSMITLIVVLIICALTLLFVLFSKSVLNVNFNKVNSQYSIFPVLYLEEKPGQNGYHTTTMMLKDEKAIELEKHYRTYSKTYPVSAVVDIGKSREENGQLMSFYHSLKGPIYLYDKVLSASKENRLRLASKEKQVEIEYSDNEQFFDLLYFDNYYVFSFKQINENYDDYDTIKIDVFSDDLNFISTIYVDLSQYNLASLNLINKSVSVYEDCIILPVTKNGKFYFLYYDIEKQVSSLKEKEYTPIGSISDNRILYLIGRVDDNIVVETSTCSGEITSKVIKKLNFIEPNSQLEYKFDKILYKWENEIFGSFSTGNQNYYFSYDTQLQEFSSVWEAEKNRQDVLLMDNKFVIEYEDNIFDLFPYTDNSSLLKGEGGSD